MSPDRSPVVLGFDGSDSAVGAESWALAEARSLGVPLRLLYAFAGRYAYATTATSGELPMLESSALRARAETMLAEAVDRARATNPDIPVSATAIDGDAVDALLREAHTASTVVLGSRRLGPLTSTVLGSVSSPVSVRSACPVVVVREPASPLNQHPAVVVGVPPDQDSHDAIAYAFAYANRHMLPLHAVLCWHAGLVEETLKNLGLPAPARGAAWVSETLVGWRDKYPDVEVLEAVTRDHAIDGLVAASLGQALLVVGTRGRGALAGTLTGSVSQGVLHHASCPVAVVPSVATRCVGTL